VPEHAVPRGIADGRQGLDQRAAGRAAIRIIGQTLGHRAGRSGGSPPGLEGASGLLRLGARQRDQGVQGVLELVGAQEAVARQVRHPR
jgi:hypothetical protein